MQYIGEILSLVVAVAWTGAALFSEAATLRIGTIVLNVIRMAGSLLVLGAILWVVTGFPLPQYLNAEAWLWLSLSGLVGYVFGDYCLFNSYLTIGSRYGQLFMTLAPLAAALAGWLILGEKMSLMGILGMLVVGTGIGMSVLNKGGGGQHRPHLKLPVRGVLYGIGAAVGQGGGLVLSKLGMEYYQDGIAVHFGGDLTQAGAVLDYVPVASTFVRRGFYFRASHHGIDRFLHHHGAEWQGATIGSCSERQERYAVHVLCYSLRTNHRCFSLPACHALHECWSGADADVVDSCADYLAYMAHLSAKGDGARGGGCLRGSGRSFALLSLRDSWLGNEPLAFEI